MCNANAEHSDAYGCEKALDGIAHVHNRWSTGGVGPGANFTVQNMLVDATVSSKFKYTTQMWIVPF